MPLRISILLVGLFVIASCGNKPAESVSKKDTIAAPPKKVDSARPGLIYPKQMQIDRKTAYDSFYKRIGDSVYICSYKGKIESADTTGKNRSFLFDIRAEYIIDEVYLYPMSAERFFIVWQETDHSGVRSYIAVFNRGENEPAWKRKVEAPSPGQPVVDNGYAYVTTLGTVAKLDLTSGNPVWAHDSLFDPLKLIYKKFNTPLVYTSSVCFYDSPIRGKKNRSDSIWVNDKTGKIGK